MSDGFRGLGLGAFAGQQSHVELREPYPSELEYFYANPHVSGMAAEDDRVILNPYSPLSRQEREAVYRNEALRVMMRKASVPPPSYDLTPEQSARFGNYGSTQDQRETLASRLYTGDPSAGDPNEGQRRYVDDLRRLLGNDFGGSEGGAGLGQLDMWSGR